jgi:hypothetical protein
MQENLKDILSHLSTDVDQETLLLYLQGKLTPEKQHELEKQLLENEFAAEALEGLQQFEDKENLALVAAQLNRDLKKKTSRKAKRKIQRIQAEPWLLLFLFLFLILILLSYLVIFRYMG